MGENEFSFDVISNGIEVWNADPISKQLSRSIDLYNISNSPETQSESEIDITTLKMLEFCRSGNLVKIHEKNFLNFLSFCFLNFARLEL